MALFFACGANPEGGLSALYPTAKLVGGIVDANSHYPLSRSKHEFDRLILQASLLEPMTRRLFEDAGIRRGMRVADVGAGAGDVCILLAEMVGAKGTVLGLEADGDALVLARERIASSHFTNISFVHSEFSEYVPEAPLDGVVGRLVLLYQRDPAQALAKIARHVRPGGVVAFMEPWLGQPPVQDGTIDKVASCIVETMRRSGAHIDLGPRLHKVFAAAGLRRPSMRLEAVMDGKKRSPLHKLLAHSYLSFMPKAIEYGLAMPGQINIDSIPKCFRAVANDTGYATMLFPIVLAWCRK